jgi:hypothetical protein
VPVILEQFTNCTLNPASADYVGAKVGDMYMTFDYDTNRLREYGQYVNQSRYVRIEMNPSVENGTADPELLPFGVFGPIRPNSWRVRSNDGDHGTGGTPLLKVVPTDSTITGLADADTNARRTGPFGKAYSTNCIDTTGAEASSADVSFTILVPTAAGGGESDTVATIILLDDSATTDPAETANTIAIGTAGIADSAKATALVAAINGTTNSLVDFASSGVGTAGVQGVTAAIGSSDTQITLTIDTIGTVGNLTNAITTTAGTDVVDNRTFSGGVDLIGTFVTLDNDLVASHYSPDHITSIVFGEDDGQPLALLEHTTTQLHSSSQEHFSESRHPTVVLAIPRKLTLVSRQVNHTRTLLTIPDTQITFVDCQQDTLRLTQLQVPVLIENTLGSSLLMM